MKRLILFLLLFIFLATPIYAQRQDGIKPSFKQGNYARNLSTSEDGWLQRNKVAHWAMWLGATGNTLYDISAFKNHGTLTNMNPATDWLVNQSGYALDFGTTAEHKYIDVANLNPLLTNQMTIIIKVTRTSTIDAEHIISRFPAWLLSGFSGGGANDVRFAVNTGVEVTTTGFTMVANVEYKVAGVYDGINIYLYINGVEFDRAAQTGSIGSSGNMRIGASGTGSLDFNWAGLISSVRFYNRAFSAGEIFRDNFTPYEGLQRND